MADLENLIDQDETWLHAKHLVHAGLQLPDHIRHLFYSGWKQSVNEDEFLRILGFSRLNPICLIEAAELTIGAGRPDVSKVREGVQNLGLKQSVIVLSLHYMCRLVLRSSPPPIWRTTFQDMMKSIEIGYRFGAKIGDLGMEGGAAAAWGAESGKLIALLTMPKEFSQWQRARNKSGTTPKLERDFFGCELYQLSAFVIQSLGFGIELSYGVALKPGAFTSDELSLNREILRWKSARLWIEALSDGRNYPAQTSVRSFFPEIAPNKKNQNITLQVLYTEIARIRAKGSSWFWHLPAEYREEDEGGRPSV